MIRTYEDILDNLFNSSDNFKFEKYMFFIDNIDHSDEILIICKNKLHFIFLNLPLFKGKGDILWVNDAAELLNRYKNIIKKENLTLSKLIPFKLKNLLDWLMDGGSEEIPKLFLYYKKEIKSITWYLSNSFLNNLTFIRLLNKHINSFYINDEFQIIKTYKLLINQQRLTSRDISHNFYQKNIRSKFVTRLLELNIMDEGDAKSLYKLVEVNLIQADLEKVIAGTYGEKINSNEDTLDKEALTKALVNIDEKLDEEKFKDKILKTLTQEVIDELELTIFDVKTLKKKNMVLYIFIDKNNNKRFYFEPFEYSFYISNNFSVLENDYIVDMDEKKHIKYTITDYNLATKFKIILNDAYKKHMESILK